MRARGIVTVVVAVALAGCGARAASGPAWPKSAGTEIDPDEEDGGESLAPRESKGAVASVESSKGTATTASEAKPEAKKADAPAEAKPESSATPATPAKPDEPTVEEIVIEVTD